MVLPLVLSVSYVILYLFVFMLVTCVALWTNEISALPVYQYDMPLQPLDPATSSVPQTQFFQLAHSLVKSTMTLLWREKLVFSLRKRCFYIQSLQHWLAHRSAGHACAVCGSYSLWGKKGAFYQKKAASIKPFRNHECKIWLKVIATILPQMNADWASIPDCSLEWIGLREHMQECPHILNWYFHIIKINKTAGALNKGSAW